MTKIPLFSIVVPVYNVEKYISECVESLLSQDYDDYEIILVDDGSPDRCPQICDEYAALHSNVRVLHKPNGGLSDARNAGVLIAKGQYITFVDSDDFWRGSDVLSGIERVIQANNYPEIIVSDFIKYYGSTRKYIEPTQRCLLELNGNPKLKILEYLYFCQADMKMSAWQKFVKHELLTRISFTKSLLSEDIDWTLQLYPIVNSICVYDKPYYCYRQQREGSITTTASEKAFYSLIKIIKKWSSLIPKLNIPVVEKELYMGYLAYQLSVSMTIYLSLSKKNRVVAIKQVASCCDMFNYPLNTKTRKVKALISIIGVKNSCIALSLFRKIRAVIYNLKY